MNTNGFFSQAREEDGLVIVSLHGEIDLAVADELKQDLQARLHPDVRMFVDCSEVAFIDSLGLQTLIQAGQAAAQLGIDFALIAPSDAVVSVLDLSGTTGLFTIFDAMPEPTAE